MKHKTTLSLLCLCVLSIGLFHRQNFFHANSSPSYKVGAAEKGFKEQNSPVEKLLAKTQQTSVWEQALQLNPKDVEAYHQLGLVLVTQNQVDKAISYYQQAIALKPPNVSRIYQSWGKALVKKNKTDDAISTFRQGILLGYPEAPKAMQEAEVHFRLGLVLETEGRLPEAIKAYRQAIAEKPDRMMYEYLGNALVKHDQLDEARVAFRKRWTTVYQEGLDYQLLGDALVRENRPDDALAAYRKAMKHDAWISNVDVHAYRALAFRLSSLNRVDQAKQAFRNALTPADRDQSFIAKDFIQFLVSHNQIAEAKTFSQKYYQSDQPFQKVYAKHLIKRSRDLIKANQLDQAVKDCNEAAQILNISKSPTDEDKGTVADIWSCLGQAQARQGYLEKALTSFQKENQFNKYAYDDIAETLVKLQRFEEALDILLKHSGQEVNAYTTLGRLLNANQQPQAAVEYCQKALTIDAQNLAVHHCLAKAAGNSKPVVVDPQLFPRRINAISPKVIQRAYRANRLGNDIIGYTLHADAIGVSHDEAKRAQNVFPHLAEIRLYQYWAEVLAQQGKRQQAIVAYHQMLRLLPETARTYTSLGKVLMQQHQYGGAISAYRRAIQLSPYEAQLYVNLSKALQALSQKETADLALHQALQLGWQETEISK